MRYALIKNGVVINVIEAEPSFLPYVVDKYDSVVDVTTTPCGPEWTHDGVNFAQPVDPNAQVNGNPV